ncbi:MAG: succinate dehydrogenase/fumarate reductase iron-sulfur subunit [Epsilonproteobacteria bacterium]|nr:succinate dehydrogenase/fumarate reductase iron-sulfur subunit [Campylobacterota bacterium]
MKISIQKTDEIKSYELSDGLNFLKALFQIKESQDNSLTFSSGCKSGVCGACAMMLDGKEVLACQTSLSSSDVFLEPLRYHEVQRDLKVNHQSIHKKLQMAKSWLNTPQKATITQNDVELTKVESDCILCHSCYSACPVLAVNENFLGPFVLSRVYRYSLDKREEDIKSSIDLIQLHGIWDCTLCGECTVACPQNIDPKMNILALRSNSAMLGYSDPNMMTMSFDFFRKRS